MTAFKKGDMILCIDTRWAITPLHGMICPVKGNIYVVREAQPMCVLLEEIRNKTIAWDSGKLIYHASGQEPTWLNHHFKKIDEEELSSFVESIKNSLDEVLEEELQLV